MATDQQGAVDDRLVGATGGGADLISALPDDLLHAVLLHLDSIDDAARTSVLSRRWHHVWAHLPELCFRYRYRQPASRSHSPDCIGDALAVYAAPTLRRLEITISSVSLPHVTADNVSSWMRFASHHLAGDLQLTLRHFEFQGNRGGIVVPVCERVTSMVFDLFGCALRFYLPPQLGAFEELSTLKIEGPTVDSRELEIMLCSRCPRLKELALVQIIFQNRAPILSIRSDSLERLKISYIHIHGGQLQVATPNLGTLHWADQCDFYIAAPKLSELCWDYYSDYDPSRQHIAEDGHALWRLKVKGNTAGSRLMRQFNTVNELHLKVSIATGIQAYKKFMEDTNKLPRCQILVVTMDENKHAVRSTMLHLLRKCSGVRKIVVKLNYAVNKSSMDIFDYEYPCKVLSGCPCSLIENRKIDNNLLDLLEEVQIEGHGEADHKVELVRLFCNCRARFHKRMVITVSEQATRVEYKEEDLYYCSSKQQN